jgi:competence protein ComGC
MAKTMNNQKGFMLMEIIISFLIISISLGIIFQNISTSLKAIIKANQRLSTCFIQEKVGVWYLLRKEIPSELPANINIIGTRTWPIEIQQKEFKLTEVLFNKNEQDRESIFIFLKKD